ncbi:MAG: DUF1659 domain-containing protein [Candidatus Omnitrophota bacterium]
MRFMTKIFFCILVSLLIILNAQGAFAASCPYCGQQYGDPMPGDEARVYALRAQHESSCPARSTTPVFDIDTDDGLRPGGTSFFGLGGGDSSRNVDSKRSQEPLFSKGTKTSAPADLRFLNIESDPQEMLKEQAEFDKMNAAWLERQKKTIKEAAIKNKSWTKTIITSIKTAHVPSPIYQPHDMAALQPGDILLIAPEADDSISNTVALLDHIYTRRILTSGEKQSPVSHALTVVKTVNGKLLFLDHTSVVGSQIFGEKEFLKHYGHRGIYVARPQSKVDGEALWQTAQEAAKKTIKDNKVGWDWTTYGLFGKDAVCSEQAAFAVVNATGKPLFKKKLIDNLKPIEVTPADLYDPEYFSNYFVVTPLAQK